LRLVGALLTDPTKAGRNARPFSWNSLTCPAPLLVAKRYTHELFATDTAKAFVDQQQHLLKAREQGAKVATPA
jgi:hypothetical protein